MSLTISPRSRKRFTCRPGILLLLLCCCPLAGAAGDWPAGRLVDMSWPYDSSTIYWPTEKGFEKTTRAEGMTDKGYYYSAYSICTAEHGGTHLDAPVHFAEGRHTADQVPVERLMGPAVVIDVRQKVAGDVDYLVSVADIAGWESRHGPIPDGSIVLLRTGFGQFWPDRLKYLGTDARGEGAVAQLHFPGLSAQAAKMLAEDRNIDAVGIDTASIDYGQSKDFMAHRILLGANIPVFENVARLEELPETSAHIVALPMKIAGGSGAPLRIVGVVK